MEENKSARLSLTITPELAEECDEFKRTEYYNKSYAEMYRDLIRAGIRMKRMEKEAE